jgi:hypothetical protein
MEKDAHLPANQRRALQTQNPKKINAINFSLPFYFLRLNYKIYFFSASKLTHENLKIIKNVIFYCNNGYFDTFFAKNFGPGSIDRKRKFDGNW